tara:strand:+ start:326 stop:580 length:255 start_codon:yes stop_codon:yes gene_type:complete
VFVKDLQQFLSKFTEASKDGTRQGNTISNAKIYIEKNGYLEEIKRMEVHENNGALIGQPSHRLVMKTQDEKLMRMPDKLKEAFK